MPPLRALLLLLHITVIHTLSLNFSITKFSPQCTNKNSGIAKGCVAYSSVIAALTKNAADRTDLRCTIRVISAHASWLCKLILHRMGNFPLPRKILAGMLPDYWGIDPLHLPRFAPTLSMICNLAHPVYQHPYVLSVLNK